MTDYGAILECAQAVERHLSCQLSDLEEQFVFYSLYLPAGLNLQ